MTFGEWFESLSDKKQRRLLRRYARAFKVYTKKITRMAKREGVLK